MEEDNIIIEDYEVLEKQPEVAIETTIDVIEVEDVETVYIDMDDAFSALGEPNEQLRHQLLTGRETPDQHPIIAITGLREELDDIESLKTVYSNKKQLADYYEWEDGNPLGENRVGYFVSICNDIRTVKICNGENIFGVIVDNVAFVGGQDDVTRDYDYGLVLYSGVADVMCELDVEVGNYVVSNDYGIAKKSESGYGYQVVALNNKNGVKHATILLNSTVNQMNTFGKNLNVISERIDDAETNIIAAMNVAQQAYNKADEIGAASGEANKNASEALDKVNNTIKDIENIEQNVSSMSALAAQARAIAESASVSAESIRKEVNETTNNLLADVNDMLENFEPIYEWVDPETGNVGAEYLMTYIKDGLATKAEVQTVQTLADDNKSAILQNGKEIQLLVSSVDKYSVGEYSQAYGLTQAQAQSILKEDMIYIPTKHQDTRSHSETYLDTEEVNEFTPGSYYKWDGADWIEYTNSVAFFSEELSPSNALKYWYIDSNEAPEGYEPHALYINQDGKWVKVNILDGNVNNRITSMIKQTADKLALDVVNTQGDVASHQQWIDNNSANIQDVVGWKSDVENDVSQIATIKQTADDTQASVALVVEKKDGENVINSASIVTAINNDTSGISISADRINMKGKVTFESFDEETKKQIEADTIDVQIWSSRGNIFKSRDVSSILTCHVFKAGVDITDTLPNNAFTWHKYNNDGTEDTEWTATPYGNHVNPISISSADVFNRAMFVCAVEI